MIEGWTYYNHALLPASPPHEEPNLKALDVRRIWSRKGLFLIRYTTDFDCGYETKWWYLIKDDYVDISKLKSNKRYKITKGLSNCEVRKVSPKDYAKQIYEVYSAAFKNYKNSGKPEIKEKFIDQCVKHESDTRIEYYGVFDKASGELAGYSLNHVFDDYVSFTTMKFVPQYLSKNASAALVYTMLYEYMNIKSKEYISDGERSIRHVTNFQDYLIEYFGFRKAYCQMHIQYRPIVGSAVKLLFPFRKLMKRLDSITVIHNVNALLDMEEVRRSFERG